MDFKKFLHEETTLLFENLDEFENAVVARIRLAKKLTSQLLFLTEPKNQPKPWLT